jgi:hypothetical protein
MWNKTMFKLKISVLAKKLNISTTTFAVKGGVRWFTRKMEINDFFPLNFVETKHLPGKISSVLTKFRIFAEVKRAFSFQPYAEGIPWETNLSDGWQSRGFRIYRSR